MKKNQLYKLLNKSESVGLLCNQSAWNSDSGKYTFQLLAEWGKLKTVFIPEHGLFGELQDQVKLNNTAVYKKFATNVQWVSLYNSTNNLLTASAKQLAQLDTIIIDLQDIGSRYYTFTSTVWLLLQKITQLNLSIKIIIADKINPAGRQVEGTAITKEFASFIGLDGLPHRHGLTLGELCIYFKNKLNANWELTIIPVQLKGYIFIAPSPNIPTIATCNLYSGQCLWEGTNLSEGRGTTLPFEMIGAPFLNWVFKEDWNNAQHPVYNKNVFVRPVSFVPVFNKHALTTCDGLHLIVGKATVYHSLAHSLQLIKYVKEKTKKFEWRPGKYEALNEKKAIELLVGDQLLLNYLEDKATWKEVKQHMQNEEAVWIKSVAAHLIYKQKLKQTKI